MPAHGGIRKERHVALREEAERASDAVLCGDPLEEGGDLPRHGRVEPDKRLVQNHDAPEAEAPQRAQATARAAERPLRLKVGHSGSLSRRVRTLALREDLGEGGAAQHAAAELARHL